MVWVENGKETTMEDIKIDMTNQEAIKALQEFALNYGLNSKMIDAFGKAIRALEDQPEWISVDDGLPSNGEEVFVQLDWGGVTTMQYYNGFNCSVDRFGKYHNEHEVRKIAFWMSLPKPKEVDDDDE